MAAILDFFKMAASKFVVRWQQGGTVQCLEAKVFLETKSTECRQITGLAFVKSDTKKHPISTPVGPHLNLNPRGTSHIGSHGWKSLGFMGMCGRILSTILHVYVPGL